MSLAMSLLEATIAQKTAGTDASEVLELVLDGVSRGRRDHCADSKTRAGPFRQMVAPPRSAPPAAAPRRRPMII